MPTRHVVRQGECISSIAFARGLFPETLWNDPANSDLKKLRVDMNTLAPGDVLMIPDKSARRESASSGARHTFVRKGVPAWLCIQAKNNGEPLANRPYTLVLDGRIIEGVTTSDGNIEIPISPRAKLAELSVGEGTDRVEYSLRLGEMNPIDTIEGVQGRLSALGFQCRSTGVLDEATTGALESFQDCHGLEVTGQLDESTRSKLETLHDDQA